MATQLDNFDFDLARASKRYPWTNWLDGKIWQLEHGTDFQCRPAALVSAAKHQAKKSGGTIRSYTDQKTAVIQYQPPVKATSALAEAGARAAAQHRGETHDQPRPRPDQAGCCQPTHTKGHRHHVSRAGPDRRRLSATPSRRASQARPRRRTPRTDPQRSPRLWPALPDSSRRANRVSATPTHSRPAASASKT